MPLGVLVLVLAARRSVLERIDRMFFREAVDTRTLMGALAVVDRARGDTLEAVCRSFSAQLRDTLHLAEADVLVVDTDSGRLISPTGRLRPLPLDSSLASGLLARPDPMTVELDQLDGWVQRLPLDEQQWLADGNVHVLLPLRAGPDLVGGDGARREAQRPPVLARRPRTAGPGGGGAGPEDREPAAAPGPECRARDAPRPADRPTTRRRSCALAAARSPPTAAAGRCEQCGGEVAPSQLPALLAGKFRLERELGRGGMGVVYLAFDTTLERPVAIKTLPRVSLAESVRLRREARAMAGFAHPHLALVFGLETWRGSPALVMEYLDGGTLADRLRRSRMPPGEVSRMAYDLAGAIAHIHDDGLLHRDIKPSNIAFTRDGQPKLLDFGLAQIFVGGAPGRVPRAIVPAARPAGWPAPT